MATCTHSACLSLVVVGFSGLVSCGDSEPTSDSTDVIPIASLTGQDSAEGCEEVALTFEADGEYDDVRWEVEGVPLLFIDGDDIGASFVAPAYHTPMELTVTATGTASNGEEFSARKTVSVAAADTPEGLIDATMPACGNFDGGVASGDPTASSVYLWTRWSAGDGEGTEPEELDVVIATDASLKNQVREQTVTVSEETDFTAVVLVDSLEPDTTYYFMFTDSSGESSMVGRTRTLPTGETDEFRFAVASCSSLWSGYFNAYARIADRDDLNLVIHLGDLVYDFADGEELIRIPDPSAASGGVADPSDLDGYRLRFKEYLQDPDQRRARQVHPWFVIWDNHDSNAAGGEGAEQAFREYVPLAPPNPSDPDGIFRALEAGSLLDILLVDALGEREVIDDAPDILGAAQWTWLENRLVNSTAQWHVYGTQKLVSELAVPDLIGSPTPWNEYTESRSRFYRLLSEYDDNLVLAGDFHTSVANDLFLGGDGEATKEAAGSTPVAAEFLPTSVSRGNFDETICGGLCEMPTQQAILEGARNFLIDENPHNVFLQLTEHGYGIVDVTPEQIVAEYWFSKIRQLTTEEALAQTLVLKAGTNRWEPMTSTGETAEE